MGEYKRELDKELFKKGANPTGNKWLNVGVYSYDGGDPKVRIQPSGLNKNAKDGDKNRWINQKALTGIVKSEVQELIKLLEQAVTKM